MISSAIIVLTLILAVALPAGFALYAKARRVSLLSERSLESEKLRDLAQKVESQVRSKTDRNELDAFAEELVVAYRATKSHTGSYDDEGAKIDERTKDSSSPDSDLFRANVRPSSYPSSSKIVSFSDHKKAVGLHDR